MKKLLLSFLLFAYIGTFAQQQPQYTHYILNHFAINPAIAGSKECLDATFGYRTQWVGFEGAPKTAFGSFHTQIGKQRFRAKDKHGLGVLVESDKFGPFTRAKLKLAYAYHTPLNREVLLSMGLFVGLEQLSFRSGQVTLINFNDNAINAANSSFVYPEVTPGVFLQNKKWFAGLSITQLISTRMKAIGTADSKLVRHGNLLGGLRLENRKWVYTPSILLKMAPAVPFAIDVNIMADYDNKISFGATYRNVDAVAALIKFKFLENFTVGYAFDYTLSKIQAAAANTHEIVLSINPCGNSNKRGSLACPTFN